MYANSFHAITELADKTRPFFVADEPQRGNKVDDPGFLTGAAGTLLALCGDSPEGLTGWDDILFLVPVRPDSLLA